MTRAALFMLIAGCGTSPTPTPTNGTADTSTPPATWPRGPVSLTLHDRASQPIEGLIVSWHDPNGVLEGSTVSDANGVVEGTVAEGGMATVFVPDEREALTIVGLQPGDALQLGPTWAIGDTDYAPLSVGYEPVAPPADWMVITAGCSVAYVSDPGTGRDVTADDRCIGSDGTVSVLAWALAASDGPAIAASAVHGLVLSEVDLVEATLPAWSDEMDVVNVTLTSPETTGTWDFWLREYAHRNGVSHPTPYPPDLDGELTADVDLFFGPTGTAERFEVVARYRHYDDDNRFVRETLWGTQRTTAPGALPVGAEAWGTPSDARWDADNAKMLFDHPSNAGDVAAVYGRVGWDADGERHTWMFVAPPGTTEVPVPEVPAAEQAQVPPPGTVPDGRAPRRARWSQITSPGTPSGPIWLGARSSPPAAATASIKQAPSRMSPPSTATCRRMAGGPVPGSKDG